MTFELGRTVATRNAVNALAVLGLHASALIQRHQDLEQGDNCDEDHRANLRAVKNGDERIMSVFRYPNDACFYVVTEHDRSVTTLMLDSDY